ncbi:DNA polymerase alpha primase associated subunit [Colletotrichum sp. SAR11_240]|nr:DNA polymerase alpha primase associated subunit [Colletotrichum sp. SAR11_240]
MSVSSASIRSVSQAATIGGTKQKLKVPPHKAILCRTCNELFDDEASLIKHKLWAMQIRGTHAHCTVCAMEFRTMDAQKQHMIESHPHEQNIICPGCGSRFTRLAGFMKHLEHDECPEIRRSDVDRNRAEKLTFAHELEKRSGSQFGDYFPRLHPSVQQSAMSNISKPQMAHPSFFRPEDFPAIQEADGASTQGSSTQGSSAQEGSVASTNLTVPNTPKTESMGRSQGASKVQDVHNPQHPNFDVMKYHNPYTRKFKCPHGSCTKNFSSAATLISHLKAGSHNITKLQCPGCLRWFKDASSLTAHSESETNRCQIRYSENYRVYLDQLTGGMADVVGKNEDNTIRYEVSTEAIIKFGPQQAKKATEDLMAKQEAERQELRQYVITTNAMAEAELKQLFTTGDKGLEPDVLSELQSIMRLHELSAEDLFYKWESYCIKMDIDAMNPQISPMRNFKKDLQDALERANKQQTHIKTEKRAHGTPRARGGDVFGMLDGLVPSTPSSGRLNKPSSLRKKETPTMSRIKAEIPSSSPDYKGSSKMEDQLSSMQSPSSFNDRQNAGDTIEVLNDHLNAPEAPICPYSEPRIKLTAASDQKKLAYKPLAMKLSEASEILDDRIDEFMGIVQEYHKLDLSEFGNAASQSTTAVIAVGRVASDAPEGKLNAASLVLELSRRMGGGQRVSLNMRSVKKGFSFFPGQIVALKGINTSGNEFLVEEVLEVPLLPNAASTPATLAAHREKLRGDPDAMDTDSDPAPLNVIYASGPYTADDNLDFEPLHALCDQAADTYADALVLTGPFIDGEHPLIAMGDFDLPEEAVIDPDTATMSTVFKYLFSPALNRLVSANPSITILLIPSVRDVIDKHVSWPQDSVLKKDLGLPKTARIVTNPMTLSMNEMVMGISSQDILWQLKHEELAARPSDTNPLSRLSRHLLEQRHFFPLFPPTDRQKLPKTGTEEGMPPGAMLDISYLKLGEMVNVRPDVLIVPSFLPPFAKVVESVLVINPGYLSKRRGAGTYARLTLFPPKVDTSSDTMVSHGIFDRARVEVKKI